MLGDLGDLPRRVAGAVAGQRPLGRQQGEARRRDRLPQLRQRHAFGREALEQLAPGLPRLALDSLEQALRLEVDRLAAAMPRPILACFRQPQRRRPGAGRRRRCRRRSARSRATAWTPPKKRLIAGRRATARPRASSRARAASSIPGSACTTPCSKCRRGARTASPAPIPCSTTRTIVCRIAERIRLEPALPRPSSISPSRRTTVGAIIEETRRPGGIRWKPSGLRSSSPSMLLRITPVPGTSTPEPEPFEQVTLAHIPSASSTEMWVVEPSRSAAARSSPAGSSRRGLQALAVQGLGEVLAADGAGRSHRGDQLLGAAALAHPLQQAEAVGDQGPARGRRRVGEHLGSAERHADRRARRRLIGGEVRRAERAALLEHELADRRGDVASVEGLGAFRAEAFEGVGELREAELVTLAQRPAAGRIELAGALQPGVDRGEDVEDVGLLGVDRRALAGQPDPGPDQVSEADRAETVQRLLEPGGGARDPARGRADVERLGGLRVEVDGDRHQVGAALGAILAGGGDEEVDQDGLGRVLVRADAGPARGAPGLEAGRGRLSLQSRPGTAVDFRWRPTNLWVLLRRRDRRRRHLVIAQAADRAADERRQAASQLAMGDSCLSLACRRWCRWRWARSWGITLPELRGFNFVGGLTLAPEYFALLIALVTYTSAFIAEIVRSGIQAVPKGPVGRRQGARPAPAALS